MDYLASNQHTPVLWAGIALVLGLLSYRGISNASVKSRRVTQSKAFRTAYNSIEKIQTQTGKEVDGDLTISELWIYPIKSLRGARVSKALITPEGFYLDRRYILLKVLPATAEEPAGLKSMHVPHIPAMCLFQVAIPTTGASFVVSFNPPEPAASSHNNDDTLEIPFEPEDGELERMERVVVEMYKSGCTAYNMGSRYNDWFSTKFGFPVVLAFWGGNARPVLGNLPGRPASEVPKPQGALTKALSSVPFLGSLLGGNESGIAFNDMAPFLVINKTSVDNVTSRIGQEVDPSKFRPNIIIEGAKTAFEEDFWAELTFGAGTKIILTANCVRCASLNVDYRTGAPGKGKDGEVLKVLQKDRRVDLGSKYSPVFGRYGFPGKGDAGGDKVLRVGDGVVVSKMNQERTTFSWPGIS